MKNIASTKKNSREEESFQNDAITVYIAKKIAPSLLITTYDDHYYGRLALLDLAHSLPEAERLFAELEEGQRLNCKLLYLDEKSNQAILGLKQLTLPISETISWGRIQRGDEYEVRVIDKLHKSYLVVTDDSQFGIIPNGYKILEDEKIRVRVNGKLDSSNLIEFIPADVEGFQYEVKTLSTESISRFIPVELTSYDLFNTSILGSNADDEDHTLIKEGFKTDSQIFSKNFFAPATLFVQFERNSSSYEISFKQLAFQHLMDVAVFSPDNERLLLEKLSDQHYWFKISEKSGQRDLLSFMLFNDQINIFGHIYRSKDKKDASFIIKNLSVGQNLTELPGKQKGHTRDASYLYASPIVFLSPNQNIPVNFSQAQTLDYFLLKLNCLSRIETLKTYNGNILLQEGRTLTIIDKFLEYQISLQDDQSELGFAERPLRIPSESDGIALQITAAEGDSLNIQDEINVNIYVKPEKLEQGHEEELQKIGDGIMSKNGSGYKISILRDLREDLLKKGFYFDRSTFKGQLLRQREIIGDFLQKKIKIDHIESLLLKNNKINTPITSAIKFFSKDLKRTELETPENNQIKAVKKAVGNQNIFLIQGPPGTGKTTVIAEIIEQLTASGKRVLVAGQNHVAVDNVLEKVSRNDSVNLLRVGKAEKVDKQLVHYTISAQVENHKIDYKTFLIQQVKLAKFYLEESLNNLSSKLLLEKYKIEVDRLSANYGTLKRQYRDRHFTLRDALRSLSPKQIEESIVTLEEWVKTVQNEYEILLKPLIYSSVDVVFATCIGIKGDKEFQEAGIKFDTVIIDEAGKANIAESLVAMELGEKVILVGDQMQLPPYMDSSLIDKENPKSFPNSAYNIDYSIEEITHALKTSFFEFIIKRQEDGQFPEDNIELLNFQHRMHPSIGNFVSKSFYNGRVNMGAKTHENTLPLPLPYDREIVFFDTSSHSNPYEQQEGQSVKNIVEAKYIAERILPDLLKYHVAPENIAVIAPYKSQVAAISKLIKSTDSCTSKNIDVSTLDSFQGKEYDVIIFSFTRSTDHGKAVKNEAGKRKFTKVGFLDDARRLNVAFSRARKKLILVGNAKTLADKKSHFDLLFDYTGLFKNLVELSKDPKIGRFSQMQNSYDIRSKPKAPRLQVGEILTGKVKKPILSKTGKIIGRIINLGQIQCLAPKHHKTKTINHFLEHELDEEVRVRIIEIGSKGPIVEIDDFYSAKKLKVGEIIQANVTRISSLGIMVLLHGRLEGIIYRSHINHRITPRVGDIIGVKVSLINENEKKIILSI